MPVTLPMLSRAAFAFCASLSLALSMTACGHGGGKGSTQTAVRIDDSELSVHQVNAMLARIPPNAPDLDTRKRDIVRSLIDQQLAANQAVAQKLDRNPDVMMATQDARRLILAQAYLETYAGKLPKPGAADIENYLKGHPELFAERRDYELLELKLNEPAPQLVESLRSQARNAVPLPEIAAQLTKDGHPFSLALRRATADQIPLALAEKLAALPVNALTDYDDPVLGFELVQIKDFKLAPIAGDDARPLIEKFLFNQKSQASMKEQMDRLRGTSKIEYFGELEALFSSAR